MQEALVKKKKKKKAKTHWCEKADAIQTPPKSSTKDLDK